MNRNKTLAAIGIYFSLLLFVFTYAGVEILHFTLLHGRYAHQSESAQAANPEPGTSLIERPKGETDSGICPICTLLSHVQMVYRPLRGAVALIERPQLLNFFFESVFLQNLIAASVIPRGPPAFFIHNLSV